MTDNVRSQLWVAGSAIAGAAVGVAATGRLEGTLAGGIVGLAVFFFFEWRGASTPSKPS